MGWRLVWTDLRRVRENSAACANNKGGHGYACSLLSAAEGDSSIGLPVFVGMLGLMLVLSDYQSGNIQSGCRGRKSIIQESFRAPEVVVAIKTPELVTGHQM